MDAYECDACAHYAYTNVQTYSQMQMIWMKMKKNYTKGIIMIYILS